MEEPDQITVNGLVLTSEQLDQLQATYGVRPAPGHYWYDGMSGLYGTVGLAAAGFMLPGHQLGVLQRDASAGTTRVVVNGRELPQGEWMVWSSLIGSPILPGAYWLDAMGNAGYSGNPMPVVNFVMAAQMGGGGGGGNIWSTRFSAGNYDAGNQQGYVSVPGHGPIGYGF